jgi:hypothetical protein
MSVAGYNVDPEESSPVVGVELGENGKATLFVDEGQGCINIPLSYNEVWALQGQLHEIHEKMKWAMASHVYAQGYRTNTLHLTTKEDQTMTLCNRKTSDVLWKRDPVVGRPGSECCKRCLSIYAKRRKQDNTYE